MRGDVRDAGLKHGMTGCGKKMTEGKDEWRRLIGGTSSTRRKDAGGCVGQKTDLDWAGERSNIQQRERFEQKSNEHATIDRQL